jgi:hypothetical protein
MCEGDARNEPLRPLLVSEERKEGDEDRDQKDLGEGEEGRATKGARAPVKPGRQEIEDHERSHIPFRSWCAHCMRGKAKASPHPGGQETARQKPIVSIDYAYLGIKRGLNKDEREAAEAEAVKKGHTPTLVMVDSESKAIFAHAAMAKGAVDDVCRQVVDNLDTLGYKDIVFKSDQEPAILSLGELIKASWNGNMALECSPVGESQSNGMIERAIQTWEGQVRTMKDALETRIGTAIPPDHPLLTWLLQHAAALQRRCTVGGDGRTPQQRIKGRSSTRPTAEFGERVWYRPVKIGDSLQVVMKEGYYIGVQDRSDESLIGTKEGPIKVRDVRRRPDDEKWRQEVLDIDFTTIRPNKSSDTRIKTFIEPGLANPAVPRPVLETVNPAARRCRLYAGDFQTHGLTIACAGCKAISRGSKVAVNHSERCRARLEGELSKSPEGRTRIEAAGNRIIHDLAERLERAQPSGGSASAPASEPARKVEARAREESGEELRQRKKIRFEDTDGKVEVVTTTGSGSAEMVDQPVIEQSGGASGSAGDLPMGEIPGEQSQSSVDKDGDLKMGVDYCVLEDWAECPEEDLLILKSAEGLYHRPDVSEAYSPPRVTKAASEVGMKGGWALDITTEDEKGQPWDFNDEKCRERVRRLVRTSKPTVLIGSPECKWFSQLQTLSRNQYKDPAAAAECLQRAIGHMEFVTELYWMQLRAGRYFVHEHPKTATSWNLSCIRELVAHPKVVSTVAHICAYGLMSTDAVGEGLVKKPIGFMTNSPEISEQFAELCRGGHRHVHLLDGRAKEAAKYSEGLCKAICKGTRKQINCDRKSRQWANMEEDDMMNFEILSTEEKEDEGECCYDSVAWTAHDDMKGGPLDVKKVIKARK